MGGDEQWGPDGEVSQIIQQCGIEGPVKPIFAMEPWTGEAVSLFEVGEGDFLVYNPIDGSLFRISNLNTLKSIVLKIEDEDLGLSALELEQIC